MGTSDSAVSFKRRAATGLAKNDRIPDRFGGVRAQAWRERLMDWSLFGGIGEMGKGRQDSRYNAVRGLRWTGGCMSGKLGRTGRKWFSYVRPLSTKSYHMRDTKAFRDV
jgi:hypothetical protein